MDDISQEDLAAVIDHTNLYADATSKDIEQLCEEAEEYGFGAVCIYSGNVEQSYDLVSEDTNVCSVVGFPSGQESSRAKADEAKYAVEQGADEIDMVVNQGDIKDGRFDDAVEDIKAVRSAVGPETTLKVIAENCNLTDDEKVETYKAADEADADFIKTSTGFGDYGARVEDVELMAETLQDLDSDMGIKASGGIGDLEKAEKILEASNMPLDPDYFRIGASGSVDIMSEF